MFETWKFIMFEITKDIMKFYGKISIQSKTLTLIWK